MTTYSNKDSEDNAIISRLQKEDDNEEVDLDVDDNNDNNEIDSAVEASDNTMVDVIIWDLEQEIFDEEMLIWEDINLGCFLVSRVHSLRNLMYSISNCVNHSSPISERGFLTAQHFVLTSKPAVIRSKSNQSLWFKLFLQGETQLQSSLVVPKTFALHLIFLST